MSNSEYLVRFRKEGRVERAHPRESRLGGYWVEIIPPGTERRISRRSFDFWRARDLDMFEVLEEPGRKARPVAAVVVAATAPAVELPTAPGWPEDRKAELRRVIDTVMTGAADRETVLAFDLLSLPGVNPSDVQAIESGDPFAVTPALKSLRLLVRGRPGRRPKATPPA